MIKPMNLFGEKPKYMLNYYHFTEDSPTKDDRLVKEDGSFHSLLHTDYWNDFRDSKVCINLYTIGGIIVEEEFRGQGIGTSVLMGFINTHKNDLILGEVGIINEVYGDPHELDDEIYYKIINSLSRYYFRLGFLSLQPFYREEFYKPLVFPNKPGIEFYKYHMSKHNKFISEFEERHGKSAANSWMGGETEEIKWLKQENEKILNKL